MSVLRFRVVQAAGTDTEVKGLYHFDGHLWLFGLSCSERCLSGTACSSPLRMWQSSVSALGFIMVFIMAVFFSVPEVGFKLFFVGLFCKFTHILHITVKVECLC